MAARDLRRLPKAHLHLHFTGGMRRSTLIEQAELQGLRLPRTLRDGPLQLEPGERGWSRFQHLYETARSTIRTRGDVERLVCEIAADNADAGSSWCELQIDPSSYAERFGGLEAALEVVLASAVTAAARTGVGMAVIVAANRARDPRRAVTLAHLAARYADDGVVGFGLSNDERAGRAEAFAEAFRVARAAGLLAVPHGGELVGPASVRTCVEVLHARRVGHAVEAAKDPAVLELMARRRVAAEVCPTSNVALGVAPGPAAVPLRRLYEAGVPIALGADDPLLFGAGLLEQYEVARSVHHFDDSAIAELAAASIRCSAAPERQKRRLLSAVGDWLASPTDEGVPVAAANSRA